MTHRILVVEDEEELSMLLRLMMKIKQSDWEMLSATTGIEALKRAEEFRPDLILLDIMLPEMDGISVCKKLREDPRWAKTSIVMLTALNDSKTRQAAKAAGANDYWTKPIMPQELLNGVLKALG
jgi:two-component system alkaline phosphatase synthesis response regulator PhoP